MIGGKPLIFGCFEPTPMMFQLLLEPLFLKGFLTGVLVLVVLEVVAIVWMVDRWLSLAAPACSTYPSKRRGSLTVHDNLEFYIAKAAEKEKEDDRGGASGQTTTGDYPGSLGSETTANTTPTSSTSSTTASKHPKNHPKIPHSHTEPWPKEVVEFLSNKLDPQDQSYKCDHHSSSTSSSSSSSSGDSDSSDNNSNNTKSNTSPTPKFASRSSKVWDLAGGGAAGVNKDRTVSSSSTNPLLPTHLSTTEHEKCQWLNILLHRFFLEVRASELYKWKMKRRITAKMNQRLKGNAFISQFRLTDFSLGCHVPYVSGVRIVKGWTEDLAVVSNGLITRNQKEL